MKTKPTKPIVGSMFNEIMKAASQLAMLVLAIFNVSAATLYVSLESPNPVPPFATWATAATNIQHAVDAARSGDTVLVTNGVYAVGGKTNDDGYIENRVTITSAIRLESVNGPVVTTVVGSSVVTNDFGDEVGWERGRCVYLGANAVLSGFTLTHGYASRQGGGVYSIPTGLVTNCVLTANITGYNTGQGQFGTGGGAYGGNLYNCTLTGNSANVSGGGASASTLYNCILIGNSASYGGGASGGTLYNCTLTGNSGRWGGGARTCTLYNCTLTDNSNGGAIASTLYNCLVTDNDGGSDGQFFNCIIVGNNGGVSGTLFNSIVYYNFGGNYDERTIDDEGDPLPGALLNNCCTTPLPTNGVGNITGHPLFRDMAAGDFRLREDSPCIDAGANLVGLVIVPAFNPDTGDPILVPYTHDPTDILGNTRFIDGNFDGTVAWDMGAYEFNSFKPPQFTCAPQRMPDCWRLSITGAPNKWVRLERSSDLKNWEHVWLWPQSNPFPMGSAGVKQVDDTDMSPKAMFYRAVVGQ